MPKPSAEPANLVLEQVRLIRAEATQYRAEVNSRLDQINARFDKVDTEIADLRRDVRGFKLNTIAEIYKANLTVASFADLDRRVTALEQTSVAP